MLGEELDGEGCYQVIKPTILYRGKSYGEWASDWLNWYLSADAETRNSGPVVFLRSTRLPKKAAISDASEMSSGYEGSGFTDEDPVSLTFNNRNYKNLPNVRVGGDRLQIFDDQAVLVPIIVAFLLRTNLKLDWGGMQDFTGLTIDYGDNPPDISQLTINGIDIQLPQDEIEDDGCEQLAKSKGVQMNEKSNIKFLKEELRKVSHKEENILNQLTIKENEKESERLTANPPQNLAKDLNIIREQKIKITRELRLMLPYRVRTPIVTAVVPDAAYGRSVKDFIEEGPIEPGTYPAMLEGYFVMLRFTQGTYWVHSWASAPRETTGTYFSELLYQIEVIPRRTPQFKTTRWRPSLNESILRKILERKDKSEETF